MAYETLTLQATESHHTPPAPVAAPAPPIVPAVPPPAPIDPNTPFAGPYVGPWAAQSFPGPPSFPSFGNGATIYGHASDPTTKLAGTGQYFGGGMRAPQLPFNNANGSSFLPPASFPGQPTAAVTLAQAYQTRLAALSSVAASLLSKREEINHVVR